MAIKSRIIKSQLPPKFSTRKVNRCWRCGRNRSFMREFNMCRISFRELANKGELPGIRKSSW